MPDEPPVAARGDAEDISRNPDAHVEQDDRAEVMRQGPRDAIIRARERSMARKRKTSPQAGGDDSATPITGSTSRPEEAEDRIVASGSAVTRTEPDDREQSREVAKPAEMPETPPVSVPTDRLVTRPVPVQEVSGRRVHDSDEKFDRVPDIEPDVELPRLRNQFRIPGSRGSGAATGATGSSSNNDAQTAYDRVLQRAQEYRRSTPRPAEPVEERVFTSSFAAREAEPAPAPDPVADAVDQVGEDEIVHFQADRSSRRVRFEQPVDYIDDVHDSALDEDYELERSFRPEETETQTGQRWWKTFGRSRVFRNEQPRLTPADEPDPQSVAAEPLSDEVEDRPIRPVTEPVFSINWDDQGLAPRARFDVPKQERIEAEATWASLDYLDDTDEPDFELRPPTWQEPKQSTGANVSRFESPWTSEAPFLETEAAVDHGPPARSWQSTVASIRQAPELFRKPDLRPDSRQVSADEFHVETTPLVVAENAAPVTEVPAALPRNEAIDPRFDYDSEYNPDFDLRRIISNMAEPLLNMEIEIAPDVPRKCATCRDFRPSENGQRGWCTNNWAFRHKPLVNAEDRPCESTIGCWWLPTDELWDRDAFLAELERRTPRTDRLMAQLYGERRTGSS